MDSVDSREFSKLENIVKNGIREVVFALTPSSANDGVILLIEDRLKEFNLKFTKIARGIPTGISIQNVDMLSLVSSFESKTDA
jgi:recombination protein RecR